MGQAQALTSKSIYILFHAYDVVFYMIAKHLKLWTHLSNAVPMCSHLNILTTQMLIVLLAL